MLKPLNDFAMIEVSTEKQIIETDKGTAESGVLVALADVFTHYGFYSFAFENSFMAEKDLKELHEYWSKQVGKKVFWLALAEKGAILKDGDKTYALIKFTSLMAVDDADSDVRNVHSDGQGAFNA